MDGRKDERTCIGRKGKGRNKYDSIKQIFSLLACLLFVALTSLPLLLLLLSVAVSLSSCACLRSKEGRKDKKKGEKELTEEAEKQTRRKGKRTKRKMTEETTTRPGRQAS